VKNPSRKADSALAVRYAEVLRLREEVERLEAALSLSRDRAEPGNGSLQISL
jgi:hypothetical protein